MNGKQVKKVRKEINSALNKREKEMLYNLFSYFNSLPFGKRVKMALRIIGRKL